MAPASVAISLSFCFLPRRLHRGKITVPRPIRAATASDTNGAPEGERIVGTLERRVGDLRALVASVTPAVASMKENIGLNFAVGLCFGISFLAAVARKIIITREHDNKGSVADLVRRGQLKSGQRGIAKFRMYNDPFNNPLVKIDEGTSTAQMFGKEYRLAPVSLTREQQAMHQKRRSQTYQWRRPTVFLKEGDSLPPDVDPDTVGWIPANHPFAAASSEVDEETAKQNVYQKDGVPSRVKAEHEALQIRLEASNDVTKFSSAPCTIQRSEEQSRLSGESSRYPQFSETNMVKNQNDQQIFETDCSSDNGSQ